MNSRGRLIVLIFLLPLIALTGCGQGNNGNGSGGKQKPLPRVEVVRPVRTSLLRTIELTANVEALQKVDLAARVPGVVDYMPKEIDIGRKVKKGEILIRLSVPDLEADLKHKRALLDQVQQQVKQSEQAERVANQEVKEAEQQLMKFVADEEFQRLKHERVMGLVKMGAQDKQLLEEAKRQKETAEAARKAAESAIDTRKAKATAAGVDLEVAKRRVEVSDAEVKRLQESISFATIKAPFDGVITRRWVDKGATIKDAGTQLLTVMDLNRVRVLIDIPQREVSLVNTAEETDMQGDKEGAAKGNEEAASPDEVMENKAKGDKVIVRIPSLAEVVPEGQFEGTITRLGKALDPVTRTMRAEVEMDNPKLFLRPGMYGKAEVHLDERSNILTIPSTSLVRPRDGKVGVYVVDKPTGMPPHGELKLVSVELGLDDGRRVEVRSGLKGDELVVSRGNGVLRVGDQVQALFAQE